MQALWRCFRGLSLAAAAAVLLSGCMTKPIKEFYSADEIKKALMGTGEADLMIYFAVDSDRISGKSDGQIAEVGKAVTSIPLPRYQVKVIGHTDSTGDNAYNLDLSQRRAKAVSKELQSRFGVDAKYLQTEGRGETDPYVSPERNELDRKYNRRVSLELVRN